MEKMRMHLSSADKKIGGVCGGIAESIGIDATVIRIIAAALLIFTHVFMIFAYIILWAALPKE